MIRRLSIVGAVAEDHGDAISAAGAEVSAATAAATGRRWLPATVLLELRATAGRE